MEGNSSVSNKNNSFRFGQVELRIFCPADLEDLYDWASDEEVTKFMTWDAFKSKEKLSEFLLKVVIPHPWFKEICFRGRPIGHVMVKQGTSIHSCRAETGYVIARRYRGMGFTTEAVTTTMKTGFREFQGIKRIEALVLPENMALARSREQVSFVTTSM